MWNIRPFKAPLTGEGGDTLIEVLVGAVLLGVIVLGTLSGFDIAGHQSVDQRQYAEAQTLADQSEDELAAQNVSTFRLADSEASKQVTVGGTTYTIAHGIYYENAKGESECSAANGSSTYIKTQSTVTWPTMPNKADPVRAVRFVSLDLTGGLIVHASNFDTSTPWTTANGTSGAFVQLGFAAANESEFGPTQFGNTGENGCAIFTGLTPGQSYEARPVNYFLSVNNPHLVTDVISSGNKFYEYPFAKTVTIPTNGTTAELSFIFAAPGSIVTEFEGHGTSKVAGDSVVLEDSAPSPAISIEFPETPAATTEAKAPAAPPSATTITASRLFPFSVSGKPAVGAPYTVYAGVCSKDNPASIGSGNKDSTVELTPGLNATTTVQVPPVKLKLLSGNTGAVAQSAPTGTTTKVAIEDTGCGYWRGYSSAATPTATASTPPGGTQGLLVTPYLPFGKYLACVSENVNTSGISSGSTYYYKKVEFENASTSGVEVPVYWGAATTTPTSPCPT